MSVTLENCKRIRNRLLTTAAETVLYTTWSNEFCREHLKQTTESVILVKIDPNNLATEELEELGFARFSKDLTLWLIPLWLLPYLVKEFKGGCITAPEEEVTVVTEGLDNAHRYGLSAYGIFKEEETV